MAGCVNGGNSGVENGAWVVSSRIDPNEIGLARLGGRCAVSASFASRAQSSGASPGPRSRRPIGDRFPDGLHARPKTDSGSGRCAGGAAPRVVEGYALAGRALGVDARSCAPVLFPGHGSARAARTMGRLLEGGGSETLAARRRASAVAAGFLGYAVATRGQLQREMELCPPESGAQGIGGLRSSVAIPRRGECAALTGMKAATARRPPRDQKSGGPGAVRACWIEISGTWRVRRRADQTYNRR